MAEENISEGKMKETIKLIEKIKALIQVRCHVFLTTNFENLEITISAKIKDKTFNLSHRFTYQEIEAVRDITDYTDVQVQRMCYQFNEGYRQCVKKRGTEAEP